MSMLPGAAERIATLAFEGIVHVVSQAVGRDGALVSACAVTAGTIRTGYPTSALGDDVAEFGSHVSPGAHVRPGMGAGGVHPSPDYDVVDACMPAGIAS